MPKTTLSPADREKLLDTLEVRFTKNMPRHPDIKWADVVVRLEATPAKLASLAMMEETGGEPDVVALDAGTGGYVFTDCSTESPAGRRSLCYDHAAWESRKEAKPASSAMKMAEEMGVDMLDEEGYRRLQTLGKFDLKTSSWLATPSETRALGGAIFGDRRYERVFIYHNGAESYYAARGWRGSLSV